MPYFSKKSKNKLSTCHSDLQLILNKAIEIFDFSILCGHRNKTTQNQAFKNNKSKFKFPNSKHNKLPSFAVDIAPYPIDWENKKKFYELAGVVKTIAYYLRINGVIKSKIKWGGDWKNFKDLPHFEIV